MVVKVLGVREGLEGREDQFAQSKSCSIRGKLKLWDMVSDSALHGIEKGKKRGVPEKPKTAIPADPR